MARLPDVTDLGARPSPRPATGIARYQTEQGGELVGQAVSNLGRDIQAAGAEIDQAQKIERERVATLRAEDAYTRLNERRLELTAGEENGFVHLQGEDAVTRPVYEEWTKRFDDEARLIESTLGNDLQKGKFRRRRDIARLQYQEGILRHLAQQRDVYGQQVFDGILATEQRSAAAKWDSPAEIALSLARISDAVETRAEDQGWPADLKQAVLLESAGKVHSVIVDQALANQQYVYAEQWFEENKENIDSATAARLARAVEAGEQRQQFADFTRTFIANKRDYQVLGQLQNEVLADPILDDTRKNTLLGQIQNQRYALERQLELETQRRERALEKAITDINANTLAGYEPSLDQMQPVIDASKGTALEAEAQRMVVLAEATRDFRTLAPAAQAEQITAAELQLRQDPTRFDRRILEAWKSIHDSHVKQIENDPITFTVRQGFVDPVQIDLSDPMASSDALASRFAIGRATSVRYGAPFKPLTEPEVKLLGSVLQQAGWKEKSEYLGTLLNAAQGDLDGYSAIMAQIAPDQPVTAVAGEYAAKGRTAASTLMLRGESILRPPQGEDGKPAGGTLLPMPSQKEMLREFDGQVREAYAGRTQLRNAMFQSARAIYAALSADAGDKDTSVLDADRWEQAIQIATGGLQRHQGRNVVLPYDMTHGEFKDSLHARTQALAASGTLDDSITASRLYDLPLEAIQDGKYVFRVGDAVLVDKEGQPVVLDFNQPAPSPRFTGQKPIAPPKPMAPEPAPPAAVPAPAPAPRAPTTAPPTTPQAVEQRLEDLERRAREISEGVADQRFNEAAQERRLRELAEEERRIDEQIRRLREEGGQ